MSVGSNNDNATVGGGCTDDVVAIVNRTVPSRNHNSLEKVCDVASAALGPCPDLVVVVESG